VTLRRDREGVAVLGVGLFTNAVWDMLSVVVPLYAVAAGLNAAEIGLIVAARSLLPTLLSIHGGILMDELGTRRVLAWVAVASAALPLLFPFSGWFTVLVLLQLMLGLATGLAMAASQTWSLQTSQGMTSLLARYSVATRIGTFIGPVVVGAVWDFFGAWIAFGCVALCSTGTIASLLYCKPDAGREAAAPTSPGLALLVPRWAPHKESLLLALLPAVAFVLAASFLRGASGAIQNSLYVVYLGNIGLSGTLIGLLVAVAELSGVLGSLCAAPMERRLGSNRLVLACICVSILSISITPLIGHAIVLLFLACFMRGVAQGMSQPLMYSILSTGIPDNRQGSSVGLRNAVVRLSSIVTPAVMGMAAETWSIEASFYAIGGTFLAATALLAIAGRRLL
jgi:MFS family permease